MSGLSLEIGAKLEQTQILSQELQQGLVYLVVLPQVLVLSLAV